MPAHPRSRGENHAADATSTSPGGSSPLTRGKPRVDLAASKAEGLIPAHAGKTVPAPEGSTHGWAHPRSRGENPESSVSLASAAGSSPLTRGKPYLSVLDDRVSGLIPAHAGKTRVESAQSPRSRAHPRSRGENAPPDGLVDPDAGSSPLTRGKH